MCIELVKQCKLCGHQKHYDWEECDVFRKNLLYACQFGYDIPKWADCKNIPHTGRSRAVRALSVYECPVKECPSTERAAELFRQRAEEEAAYAKAQAEMQARKKQQQDRFAKKYFRKLPLWLYAPHLQERPEWFVKLMEEGRDPEEVAMEQEEREQRTLRRMERVEMSRRQRMAEKEIEEIGAFEQRARVRTAKKEGFGQVEARRMAKGKEKAPGQPDINLNVVDLTSEHSQMTEREYAARRKAEKQKREKMKAEKKRIDQMELERVERIKAEQRKFEQTELGKMKAEQKKIDRTELRQMRAEQRKIDQTELPQMKAEPKKIVQIERPQMKAEPRNIDQSVLPRMKAEQRNIDQIERPQIKVEQKKIDRTEFLQMKAKQKKIDQAELSQMVLVKRLDPMKERRVSTQAAGQSGPATDAVKERKVEQQKNGQDSDSQQQKRAEVHYLAMRQTADDKTLDKKQSIDSKETVDENRTLQIIQPAKEDRLERFKPFWNLISKPLQRSSHRPKPRKSCLRKAGKQKLSVIWEDEGDEVTNDVAQVPVIANIDIVGCSNKTDKNNDDDGGPVVDSGVSV